MAATPTAVPGHDTGSQPDGESGECQLLGSFAIFIQGALGALALLSLVYKRWRERPQRPIKIWAFDASKQVVGSVLLHIVNLLMSMLSSGQLDITSAEYQANPCSFYLLNLAIDTTLGIPILIVLLRVLHYGASKTQLANPPESIKSGYYGRPPKTTWWLKQSMIYFIGLLGMKFCVYIIFATCPWIVQVGDWALRWTEGNEQLQIFFVMLFFPLVMNAMQYYIIDGFIKNGKPAEHDPIPSQDEEGDDDEYRVPGPDDDDIIYADEDGDDDAEVIKDQAQAGKGIPSQQVQKPKLDSNKLNNYDPKEDADGSPTIIGSSSNSIEGAALSGPSPDKTQR